MAEKAKSSHPDADLHPVATGLAKKTVDVCLWNLRLIGGCEVEIYTLMYRSMKRKPH